MDVPHCEGPKAMNLTGIALAGKSLLVSTQSGIVILDISNPRSPQMQHNLKFGAEATVVKAAGNLGYAAFGSTLVPINIDTGEVLDQRTPLVGSVFRLTADVAAYDQVRKVDFYLNGQKVATTGSYPYEYRFCWRHQNARFLQYLSQFDCMPILQSNTAKRPRAL
jgi:hypothetical protein